MTTNFEKLLKIIGLITAIIVFIQVFVPIIQNLIAEGILGAILIGIFVWWLIQDDKKRKK